MGKCRLMSLRLVMAAGLAALTGCSSPAAMKTREGSAPGRFPVFVVPPQEAVASVATPTPPSACSPGRVMTSRTVQQTMQALKPVAPKDEFETSEEHADRATRLQTIDTRQVAIFVPLEPYSLRYDADNQVMRIGYVERVMFAGSALTSDAKIFEYLSASRDNRSAGTYRASNAFGASVTVERTVSNQLGLTFPGLDSSGWPRGSRSSGDPIQVPMDRAAARSAKDSIGVMFVGPLLPPFVQSGNWFRRATLADPDEVRTSVRVLLMQPTCSALVNRRTGEVLREF